MNKGLKLLAVFLWISFIGCLLVIFYLSFQTGEAAKEIDKSGIYTIAQRYYGVEDIPDEVFLTFTYKFRQIGRVILFCMLAFLGTCTIHLTFHKWPWIIRAIISGGILFFVAIFTEEYKNFLPTRHFSKEEMLLSVLGVFIGFFYISTITGVYAYTKWSILKRNN